MSLKFISVLSKELPRPNRKIDDSRACRLVSRPKLQILKSVVVTDSVSVVDGFTLTEIPTKVPFHYVHMFSDKTAFSSTRVTWDFDRDVPLSGVEISSGFYMTRFLPTRSRSFAAGFRKRDAPDFRLGRADFASLCPTIFEALAVGALVVAPFSVLASSAFAGESLSGEGKPTGITGSGFANRGGSTRSAEGRAAGICSRSLSASNADSLTLAFVLLLLFAFSAVLRPESIVASPTSNGPAITKRATLAWSLHQAILAIKGVGV